MTFIDDLFAEDGEDVEPVQKTLSNLELITEGKLKDYFRCPYSYYLKYHVGMAKIPISAFAVQAILFESSRRGLYNLTDHDVGKVVRFQFFAGPQGKSAQQMTREELDSFLAVKEMGGWLTGKYQAVVKDGFFNDRPVAWNFKSQIPANWESFQQRVSRKINPLYVGGNRYRKFVLENGAPVFGTIGLEKGFEFEGNIYQVKFPEIRPGMIIDDPTLWGFNACFPEDKRTGNIETSSLVTLRILGYCRLAHEYPLHRETWQVPEELAAAWDGKKKYIGEEVKYRHLNCTTEAKKVSEAITITTRSDKDLGGLRKARDLYLDGITKKKHEPDLRGCGSCPYSVQGINGRIVCDELRISEKKITPAKLASQF